MDKCIEKNLFNINNQNNYSLEIDDDDPCRNRLRFNEASFVEGRNYNLPHNCCDTEFFGGLYDNSFNNEKDMVLDFNVTFKEY